MSNSVEKFEDLITWQKSKSLYLGIYKKFKDSREFYFKDQICRASLSIMNNIAEGFERFSVKEYVRFLFIAKGSCGEVRSMLNIAVELQLVDESEFKNWNELSIEISKCLAGMIKSLQRKII
ncbi:four helix bundle protein [Candidatus Falkowbacteria bacterium]|jgi:four helix bundle protein|nr:four helix bundle protein [Candidatus Falkowbacteria bacterium]